MNKEREKGKKKGESDGRRDGRQKTKSRGDILVARKVFTVEIYTVSIPEKKQKKFDLPIKGPRGIVIHARK